MYLRPHNGPFHLPDSLPDMLFYILLGAGLFSLGRWIMHIYRAADSVKFLPGYRTLFSMHAFISHAIPPVPGIVPGNNFLFLNKYKTFELCGWDIYSLVSAWPVRTTLCLADAAAIKEVTASRLRFVKPVEMYEVLAAYGSNVLVTEGESWKRHRRISAPAFSEPNNKLVWNESVRVVDDLLSSTWANKDEVSVDNCLFEVTLPLALFVIGAAGFGRRISWVEDTIIPTGHRMTFKDALHTVSVGIPFKVVLPSFVMRLSSSLRKIDLAFHELRVYMKEMVHERLASMKTERHDLFANLLEANSLDEGALTNDELIGNVFIFLLAGHETTANTLCFTFALLAFHPEIQEQLFEHIRSVVSPGTLPAYDQAPQLSFAMAVINETLRMFPPASGIPKESDEDTALVVSNVNGEKLVVPVPKGTKLVISTPGLHYNPRYWKDPHIFNPSRFLGEWDRNAFLPFSAGARACLGRRFTELESLAVLCMIVSSYRIEIKDEPQFVGESLEARKERVLRTSQGMTVRPERVPLTFKRRVQIPHSLEE
ncbi:hypothetical protein AX14_007768 [Amanita brunnescens Koide BX004]|nr:hypothetical protein AX14_007768 [Amanita brunnescens Koide BX004]